ncbi:MAG TPA: hypothetical protein VF526_01375 [Solirubrobacteraceae bacterium]
MMRAHRLLILAVVLCAMAVSAAVAFWTATGSTSASASVGTLNAPTDASASATPGSSTVHVTWTASPPAGALTPTGYYILRHATGGETSAACTSTASSLVQGTSCSDTAVADGSYTYSVIAKYASWTATSTPSPAVSVVSDNTAPTVTVNQKSGQNDPTRTLPIRWTVAFSEPVTGLDASDVTRGGTTSGGAIALSGSGANYEISLSGTPTNGTTTFTIAAASAQDLAGNTNTASTSTDNSVSYDSVAPSTTIVTSPAGPDGTNAWFQRSSVPFTLAASDATAGVAGRFYTLDGGSSQAYSAAVSVSGQGTHTVTYWSTDDAGNVEGTQTKQIKLDSVAPTNALALTTTNGGGSLLSGSTLYYRGTTAGSFHIQNTTSDAGSGVASSSFGALAGTSAGWTHSTPDTQTSPSGGPYASNTFSWAAGTTSAPTEVVTGADVAGNTTAAPALMFTNDSTAPSGGAITYTNAFFSALSVPITTSDGTDAGSGLDLTTGAIQRDQIAPTATGACGAFPGTFATAVTPAGGADTTVLTNTCYRYRYRISDRVGNQTTYTSTNTAKIDTTGPTPSSITAANHNSTPGEIDKANGASNADDTLTFTYTDAFGVDPGTIATGLTTGGATGGAPQNVDVDVTFTDGGGQTADSITVPGLGTVNLGSATWLTSTTTKKEQLSAPALNQFVITITNNPGGTSTGNEASPFTWSTTAGTAKDGAGNRATGSVTNTSRF